MDILLALTGLATLFSIEVDHDLDLTADRLQSPSESIAVKDEALTQSLLNSRALPDRANEATLLSVGLHGRRTSTPPRLATSRL